MADICDITPPNPVKSVSTSSEPRAATLGNLAFASAGNESVSDSASDRPRWPGGLKGPDGLEEPWKAG